MFWVTPPDVRVRRRSKVRTRRQIGRVTNFGTDLFCTSVSSAQYQRWELNKGLGFE